MRGMCVCAAVVCLVLAATPAAGSWDFWFCEVATPEVYGVDARFYENDQTTLVKEGALVQFVIALDGAPIVDPLEHFDYDHSGKLESGTAEYEDMAVWVNAGANPAAISGGTNVLMTDATGRWNGESELDAPGYFIINATMIPGEPSMPYRILPGNTFSLMAYRVWNLTEEEMATFCTRPLEELWYLTGREIGTHSNQGGGPDTGWWLCMPGHRWGGAPAPEDWVGFNGLIAMELKEVWELGYSYYPGWRDKYTLQTLLGRCIPEPGTMLLIGGSVLLLLLRRKK